MKKFAMLAAVAAMAFGLVSCKKDYSCSCTYDFGSGDTTTTTLFSDVKKKDAEDACDQAQAGLQSTFDPNASCSLD